tara:strand:+ start:5414 stop:6211 length:798 start_codon:yes stop_codon:yes gene_type:complete
MIYKEIAKVISTTEIAENIYKTCLKSPNIAGKVKPGQFINILPSFSWNKVMRRPMSIASQEGEQISIIYKVIGEGTKLMKDWKLNENVDIIGPLGNYWQGYDSVTPILIAGGVGIAPILNLHSTLKRKKIDHYLIMGARNNREHFIDHEPNKNIYLSTDDGSLGIKGNVIDAIDSIDSINKIKNSKIYVCGPSLMMESIRKYSLSKQFKCDAALETIMACGIGICQGCTVEKSISIKFDNSYRKKYVLACIDGPIFNVKEIVSCK